MGSLRRTRSRAWRRQAARQPPTATCAVPLINTSPSWFLHSTAYLYAAPSALSWGVALAVSAFALAVSAFALAVSAVALAVTVSAVLAGALNRTFSLPFVSHASPSDAAIISEIVASTNIPCAIVPPKGDAAANASSTWIGLWSSDASAYSFTCC